MRARESASKQGTGRTCRPTVPPVLSGPLVTKPGPSVPTGGHQVPSTYWCLFPRLYSRIINSI